jgi:hypothetical protein
VARIEGYVGKAVYLDKPMRKQVRSIVHSVSPEIDETLKWSHPSFMYKGMLCGMAAFKEHCSFGFWKSALVLDGSGKPADEAWGQFGRLTSVSDLPSKRVLTRYVRIAMKLNDDGVTVARPSRSRGAQSVFADLESALAKIARRGDVREVPAEPEARVPEWIIETKQAEIARGGSNAIAGCRGCRGTGNAEGARRRLVSAARAQPRGERRARTSSIRRRAPQPPSFGLILGAPLGVRVAEPLPRARASSAVRASPSRTHASSLSASTSWAMPLAGKTAATCEAAASAA